MKIPFRGEMPTIIEFASENPQGQRDRGKHWVNDQRVEGGGYWRKNRGGSGVEGTGGKRRVGTVKEGKEVDSAADLLESLGGPDEDFGGEEPKEEKPLDAEASSEYTPDVGNGADADTGDEKMDTHLTAAIKKNEMVVLQVGERGKIAYIPKSHKLFNRVVARYSDLSQDDVHGAVVAEYMEKHDEALSVSDYIINPPTVDGYAPKYRATKVRAGGNGEPDIDFLTREGGAVWKTFKWVGMSRREGRRMMGLSLNDA